MGFIRSLLGIVVLLAIIVFGYWLYATYTIASANDEMWVEVNSRMPDPLRKWKSRTVSARRRSRPAAIERRKSPASISGKANGRGQSCAHSLYKQ
jgi:hypothetical protein